MWYRWIFVAFMDRLVKEEHLSRTAMVDVIQEQILGSRVNPTLPPCVPRI